MEIKKYLLLILAMLLTGCASWKTSIYKETPPELKTSELKITKDHLVEGRFPLEIRWIASIDQKALPFLKRNYLDQTNKLNRDSDTSNLCNGSRRESFCRPDRVGLIPQWSTYYAMEFYKFLRHQHPDMAISLSPQVLIYDGSAKVVKAISIAEALPASQLAFGMHNYISAVEQPLDYIMINSVAKVAGFYQRETCGLVSTHGLYYFNRIPEPDCLNSDARHPILFDVFGFASGNKIASSVSYPSKNTVPVGQGQILNYPFWFSDFSDDYLDMTTAPDFEVTGENIYLGGFSDYAKSSLKVFETFRWKPFGTQEDYDLIGYYDPGLLEKIKGGYRDSSIDRKLRIIKELAIAEVKWSVDRNDRIADAILNEAFGKSFRDQRKAEEEAKAAQTRNALLSMVATVGAGAASGLFSAPGSGAFNPLMFATSQIEVNDKFHATNALIEEQMLESFMGDVKLREHSIGIVFGDLKEDVSAKGLGEFREKLKGVYAKYSGDAVHQAPVSNTPAVVEKTIPKKEVKTKNRSK